MVMMMTSESVHWKMMQNAITATATSVIMEAAKKFDCRMRGLDGSGFEFDSSRGSLEKYHS